MSVLKTRDDFFVSKKKKKKKKSHKKLSNFSLGHRNVLRTCMGVWVIVTEDSDLNSKQKHSN